MNLYGVYTGFSGDTFSNSVLNGQIRLLKFGLKVVLKNRAFENVDFGLFYRVYTDSLFRCLFFFFLEKIFCF